MSALTNFCEAIWSGLRYSEALPKPRLFVVVGRIPLDCENPSIIINRDIVARTPEEAAEIFKKKYPNHCELGCVVFDP